MEKWYEYYEGEIELLEMKCPEPILLPKIKHAKDLDGKETTRTTIYSLTHYFPFLTNQYASFKFKISTAIRLRILNTRQTKGFILLQRGRRRQNVHAVSATNVASY